MGRQRFIWTWGVLRFGLPLSLLATLLRAATEPFELTHFVAHLLANGFASILGGYVAGRLIWQLILDRDTPRRR